MFSIPTAFIHSAGTICSLALAICFLGCSNNNDGSTLESTALAPETKVKEVENGNDVILIFLDKTLSLNDQSVLAKFKQPVQSKLYDLVNEHEDRVAVHLLHANTASSQAIVSKEIDVPPLNEAELEEKGNRTQQDMIDGRNDKLNRERNAILKDVKTAFDVDNMEKTRLQTDIWGALEVMSETFANCSDQDLKHVIFVSDMEESMKGEQRRDFTKKAPIDKTEAEAWAKQDLEKIQKNYKIQMDVLAGTRLSIYLPSEAQKDNDFRFVKYYWEAIFDALNIAVQDVSGIEIGM